MIKYAYVSFFILVVAINSYAIMSIINALSPHWFNMTHHDKLLVSLLMSIAFYIIVRRKKT